LLGLGTSFAVESSSMFKEIAFSSPGEVRHLKRSVLGVGRSTPHLGRKFYHFAMGIFCVALYAFFLTKKQALMVLGSVGGVFVILDFFRLRNPRLNTFILKYFGKIMRREELKSISGNSFYILGLLVLVIFFPKPVVLLSALYLAIGDPIAAVVGTQWGKTKLTSRKTWEGALANFFATAVTSFCFGLWFLNWDIPQALGLALLGGSISTLVELIPLPVDDNFTIPVGSALFFTLLASFFPVLAALYT